MNPKDLEGELRGEIPEFAEIFDDLHSRLIQSGLSATLQNHPLSFVTNMQEASFLLKTGELEYTTFRLRKGKIVQPWPPGDQGVDYRELGITQKNYGQTPDKTTKRHYEFTGTRADMSVMGMTADDWKSLIQELIESYNKFVGEYNRDVGTRQMLEAGIDPSRLPLN